MTRPMFLLLMVAIAAVILIGMWLAWRARQRRDADVAGRLPAFAGDVIASFPRVAYVSTTPQGRPFERVAIPGLVYKGNAALTVLTDGLEIAVTGEQPVRIAASQLRGTDTARGRVGKVVERDGIAVLHWQPMVGDAPDAPGTESTLESGFRFSDTLEQRQFAHAIAQLAPQHTSQQHTTSPGNAL